MEGARRSGRNIHSGCPHFHRAAEFGDRRAAGRSVRGPNEPPAKSPLNLLQVHFSTSPARLKGPPPVIDRLPPQNSIPTGVLGSILIDRDAIIRWRTFSIRGLLPPGPRPHLRRDAGPLRASRANRRGHRRGGAGARGELDGVGGASYLSTLGNDTPPQFTSASTAGSSSGRRCCGA